VGTKQAGNLICQYPVCHSHINTPSSRLNLLAHVRKPSSRLHRGRHTELTLCHNIQHSFGLHSVLVSPVQHVEGDSA